MRALCAILLLGHYAPWPLFLLGLDFCSLSCFVVVAWVFPSPFVSLGHPLQPRYPFPLKPPCQSFLGCRRLHQSQARNFFHLFFQIFSSASWNNFSFFFSWVVCVALFCKTDIGESSRSVGILRGGPRSTCPRNGSQTCHITPDQLDLNLPSSPEDLGRSNPHPPPWLRLGYTDPLLCLFKRTNNYPVDDQRLLPWWLRSLSGSKVRSASLVRALSDGKISWLLESQGFERSSTTHN